MISATLIFSDSFDLEKAISAIIYNELNDKYDFNFDFEEDGNELTITTFNNVSHLEMQNICDDLHIDFYQHDVEFVDFNINEY
jgi:hypothetical protein